MYPTHRRAGPTDDAISISCRFIATDQWFRTHIDPAWTIFELKRHLLARCVGAVPLAPALATSAAPRLLIPSPQGRATLAGLVRPPHTSAIKSSARPSTAPHDDNPRRKPRLSLKVVPGLVSKPATQLARAVTVHPPTPGFGFGAPLLSATGPQPPPTVYFSPRINPISSPELSPPRFAPPHHPTDDESVPSSPSAQHDSSIQPPSSHATSPTFSSSPPSRPFSPTSLPGPVESQLPLFGAADQQRLMFGPDVSRARSTPPLLVRAMSTPPSPYSPKPPTPTIMSRPPAPQPPTSPPPTSSTARSPPLSSSLQSRYDLSRHEADLTNTSATSTIVDDSTLGSDSTHSPLLSVAEFLDTEEPTPDPRSPSPPGPGAVYGAMMGAGKMRGKASREQIETERTAWEDEFRLVSFGLGCVLDEHGTVADLRIRPGELIEIQRTNATIHLARPTYTQPYFEAPVYVLKRFSSSSAYTRPHTSHHHRDHHHHHHLPSRPHQHHIQPSRDYVPQSMRDYTPQPPQPLPPHPLVHASIEPLSPMGDPGPSTSTRVRSGTVTARDPWDTSNWDVDQEGEGWAELEMSGLEGVAGNGGGGVVGGKGGWGEDATTGGIGMGMGSEKVEWKLKWMVMREGRLMLFRSRGGQQICSRSLTTLLSAQQLPATPVFGNLPRHYISIHFTNPSRRERERDGEFGLRMMDGASHAHLLRVLLRIINTQPNPHTHTLLPTDTPLPSSAPLASQYPEWRQHVVQRAWLAGRGTSQIRMGNVAGPWMRLGMASVLTERELEMVDDSDGSAGSLGASEGVDWDGVMEDNDQRGEESEIEWDVEGWRAWESETAGGAWSGTAWLKASASVIGRPRSRSLAAPMSRSTSQQATPQPHQQLQQQQQEAQQMLLSPTSTVSSLSSTSPSTRRGRSSTIAGGPGQGPGPDSPISTSPSAWSPISSTSPISNVRRPLTAGSSTGIETVLRTSERRGSAQRSSDAERRGSANSLEMQRAVPSRRAVTGPATKIV